jgi:F-type H+-transporting ATPase subunit b
MRRLLFILLLLCVPAFLSAQTSAEKNPGDVAHGAEKSVHEEAHPNEEHGGEHEEPKFLGMPAWIFKLINMILFIGALAYFLGGPIKNALKTRHERILREAEEAKARRAKADQLATDIEARLKQIETDVASIHERAAVEGERQKRELLAAAEAEAQKILNTAKNEVENRLKHARQELTEYAGQLASQRAEQILREKTTDEDRRRIFTESVREVSEVKS